MSYRTNKLSCCSMSEIIGLNSQDSLATQRPRTLLMYLAEKFGYIAASKMAKGNPNRLLCGRSHLILSYAYSPYEGQRSQEFCFKLGADDTVGVTYFTKLQKYLARHKLGQLHILPSAPNPNYRNERHILPAVLMLDQAGMLEWCNKLKIKTDQEAWISPHFFV